MQALCVRLGIAPGAAFVVAVAYGFGWHGTPGRVHILQSQHLWLPVIALALDRLRERASAGRTLVGQTVVVAGVVAAALLSSYHMAVYAGVAETSVYVGEKFRGRGVGKALMHQLVAAADEGELWTLQTSIFPENRNSVALHHGAGFRTVGIRERIGELAGRWRDTVLLERRRASQL